MVFFPFFKYRMSECEVPRKKNEGELAIEDNPNNDSLIDVIRKIPINPFIDSKENLDKYKYTVDQKNIEGLTGVRVYEETDEKDDKKNKPIEYPFPIDKEIIFKKNNVSKSDDRININYSNVATDIYPEEGYKTPNRKKHFSADWELLLAHNHNLYEFKNNEHNAIINRDRYVANTENDVRNKLNLFVERINVDNAKDACKYLAIEEYKCLLSHSFHMNPNVGNQKCVKWFNEYMQCKWDEHKLNHGYNYIEDRRHKKSKSYIAAPDYQYS